MKIQPIGTQLKKFRKEHKKTLAFVASRIGTTSSYISQLENEVRNPSDNSLFDILTKAYELEEDTAEKLIRSWRIKQYTSSNISAIESQSTNTLLPFFREITKTVDASTPVEMRSFYLDPSLKASDYFLWEMHDDSMEPDIPKGTLLLVYKDISDLLYHNFVLTKIGQDLTLRQYEKQEDRVKLIAVNRNFPVFFGQDPPIYGVVKKMLVDI